MIKSVKPGCRTGTITISSSKSCAHRALICAALSNSKSTVYCDGVSKDIIATVNCLNSLGAEIAFNNDRFEVSPIKIDKGNKLLPCSESGSTLRFLLPLVGCFDIDTEFVMEGLLSSRPHDELIDELERHGMKITKDCDRLKCSGKLSAGEYKITGSVSSQFISGLLFALPLLDGDSTLEITGQIESADYIALTESAIADAGISFLKDNCIYTIPGNQNYNFPKTLYVEGDWSNAAFFLCMGALSKKGISVLGLSLRSKQGDKRIIDILKQFGADVSIENYVTVKRNVLKGISVDASHIPDLVPTICALASVANGQTVIYNAERLRYKESDRIKSTANMLKALGADVIETADGLVINGKDLLSQGTINSQNDHRIAMSAAVAANLCDGDVEILDAQSINKSYPRFFDDLDSLEVE